MAFCLERVSRSDVINFESVVATTSALLFTFLLLFFLLFDYMSLFQDQIINLTRRPVNFLPLVDLCLFSSRLKCLCFLLILMSSCLVRVTVSNCLLLRVMEASLFALA